MELPLQRLLPRFEQFHHLLLAETDVPLVATSGNLSDEPIAIDERVQARMSPARFDAAIDALAAADGAAPAAAKGAA